MRLSMFAAFLLLGLTAGFAQKKNVPRHHANADVQHKVAPVAVPKNAAANSADVQLKRLEQQTGKAAGPNAAKKNNVAPVKVKTAPAAANKNAPIAFKGQAPPRARGEGKAAGPRTVLRAHH